MEIRSTTISFSKGKVQAILKHEVEIKQQLDELDKIICNSQNLDNIDGSLKQYDDLKKELQHQYDNKGRTAIFRCKCHWVEEGEKATKSPRTGLKRWERDISIDTENWTNFFLMASKTCKENKLKEFQFKFIHRIVITKKELFRYGINTDSDCINCGEPDSINHTFVDCEFTKTFTCKVITPFAVHLQKISIHLSPNLFHYGQYTLINTNMTFICA